VKLPKPFYLFIDAKCLHCGYEARLNMELINELVIVTDDKREWQIRMVDGKSEVYCSQFCYEVKRSQKGL
jgi:hypothetical protein